MATDQLPSALPKNLWDLTPKTDEIMEELYTFRAEYAARFDYDLDRIHADPKAEEAQIQRLAPIFSH
ncbi:MAG: hypothetical protein JO185_06190 [Acidobacteriaceae bacterium]|nr:hypothetical protein [Acidobacteriaceae bacterium]MBV9938853.1 hypothetical protein [Acidobacteriaceae bacterium]